MVFLRSVCDTVAFVLNTCNQPTIVLNTYNQPTIVLQYATVNHAVLSSIGDIVSGGSVMWLQVVWCLKQAFLCSCCICNTIL